MQIEKTEKRMKNTEEILRDPINTQILALASAIEFPAVPSAVEIAKRVPHLSPTTVWRRIQAMEQARLVRTRRGPGKLVIVAPNYQEIGSTLARWVKLEGEIVINAIKSTPEFGENYNMEVAETALDELCVTLTTGGGEYPPLSLREILRKYGQALEHSGGLGWANMYVVFAAQFHQLTAEQFENTKTYEKNAGEHISGPDDEMIYSVKFRWLLAQRLLSVAVGGDWLDF